MHFASSLSEFATSALAAPGLRTWLAVLAGSCALVAVLALRVIAHRMIAAHRHDVQQAASLFAVREIGACVHAPGPLDHDALCAAVAAAPPAAVFQYLRLQRGEAQFAVTQAAEVAGVFDGPMRALGGPVVSREIAALKQLQLARAPRFRAAVRARILGASTAALRCEALYTFLAMGSTPSPVALAIWIDSTGPAATPRHASLFALIGETMPHILPQLALDVTEPALQAALARLWAKLTQGGKLPPLRPAAGRQAA